MGTTQPTPYYDIISLILIVFSLNDCFLFLKQKLKLSRNRGNKMQTENKKSQSKL